MVSTTLSSMFLTEILMSVLTPIPETLKALISFRSTTSRSLKEAIRERMRRNVAQDFHGPLPETLGTSSDQALYPAQNAGCESMAQFVLSEQSTSLGEKLC